MILVRTSLLLSLFVSLAAFAAAPVITFESDGTYATVPPGHRIAWVSLGSPSGIGMAADTDSEGRIRIWSSPVLHDAIVADVETGEWTSRGLTESALPPYTVVPGPSGAYTAIYVPLRAYRTWGFWVRPGVGRHRPRRPPHSWPEYRHGPWTSG